MGGSHLLSDDSASVRPVRKAVTVLFADVVGFTTLAERVDAERLRRVMERYFEAMSAVIERHGGVVEKFIGDAVMAVFGVPTLHEDDALRAVRAALHMRAALADLNLDLEREWGVALQVRTGVNTGEVAAVDSGPSDMLVFGDAVNVAARLEQAAEPQEILIGSSTHRLVRGHVYVEEVEPLALKGKGQPVEAVRLVGLRSLSPIIPHLDTPLVGRDAEWARLQDVWAEVLAGGSCRLVLVIGAAGIGKSRLVAEWTSSVANDARVVEGQCPSYGEGITFWPITQVVTQLAGILDDDSPDAAADKLAVLLGDAPDSASVAGPLQALLGLPTTPAGSEQIFWAVRRLLEAAARARPLVVVLEDLHWAQPLLLELVEHVVDFVVDAPILLCCPAREELLEEHPDWLAGRSAVSSVRLGPLDDGATMALVCGLLHGDEVDPSPGEHVRAAAQGNPLYVEEMVAALLESGLLERRYGRWVTRRDLHVLPLPLSIQSLLAARLDRLDGDERHLVGVASVIGVRFEQDALEALMAKADVDVPVVLGRLLAKGILRSESVARQGTFGFSHVLLRDAAYGALSKEVRSELHERFVDWAERTQLEERIGEYEELLGSHLEHAFRYRVELRPVDDHARRLGQRAGDKLGASGRRAFSRDDVVAAVNLLSRALDVLPADSPARVSLLTDLSEALMMTGRIDRAADALESATKSAEDVGDRAAAAHVTLVRTMQRLFTRPEGWADDARREVGAAVPVFEELHDELGLARSWRLLSFIEVYLGRFAAATQELDRSALHARRAGDRREELESLAWLPMPLLFGPMPVGEALGRCDEIEARAAGDPKVHGTVCLIRAGLEAMRGDVARARSSIAEARAVFEDLGLRLWIAGPTSHLAGLVELYAGDAVAADRALQAGYDALAAMGESSWLSTVAGLLATTRFAKGEYDEAERLAVVAEETGGSDDVFSQVLSRSVRAKVQALRGDAIAAEALGREAVRLATATDALQLQGEALMDLAEVTHLAGADASAARLAEEARELFERKQSTVAAGRARDRQQVFAS